MESCYINVFKDRIQIIITLFRSLETKENKKLYFFFYFIIIINYNNYKIIIIIIIYLRIAHYTSNTSLNQCKYI